MKLPKPLLSVASMRVVNLTSMPKRKPLLAPYHDLTDQDKIHELAKAAIILESLDADGTVTAATAAIEEIRKAQRNLRWKIREERLAKGRENGVQLKIFHFMRVDS